MKVFNYLFVLLIGLGACEHNAPVAPVTRDLTGLEKQLVESDNKFGFKLFKAIVEEEGDKNVFISPLSVSMALGMTLNGANGETKTAMEETLEFTGLSRDEINQSYKSLIELLTQLDLEVVFEIANSIWYREGMQFEETFFDVNKTYFDALVQALDFGDPASVDIINDWVKENTNGKIEEIIDSIDPGIVMFLINAIYFNGTWTYEFDKELTKEDSFTLPDGTEKSCKMMVQTGKFKYLETDDFQAIDLPYGGQQFSMTILLPNPSKNLDTLIEDLDPEIWHNLLANFSADSVTLQLPKFKLEYEIKLNDVLSALGMQVAFAPGADFTRMYRPGGLWIDYVRHKTFVEVDEEGTEAAAVTVVAIRDSAGGPEIKFMRVNRSFLFVIRENHSQTILFMGKIVEPVSG
ncbi:serpin family protein [candidate division KSB1 bacterium]|nr:serpin family protein [candidate division KSB1 bacterium]NIR72538.1 serpin family protein [candidate division KSB1 bacterium]NIS23633.1 serpin family protein [candidate division KSB1 bacterium]NIT70557.1 serpin family protein [candidate division KSB1 bacterium]NIU24275.1 serpin family protein [candidate division KSB1 bacterium]